MHRYPSLRRGLTSASALFSTTALLLGCASPSSAFDADDPGLWETPKCESLMDFVPGRVEPLTESGQEDKNSLVSADTASLRSRAAAAFADSTSAAAESAGTGPETDAADDRDEIATKSRNGVVIIDTPDEWRGRGSYRHHAFRPEGQPALGYRPHSNGWFSTGPQRAPRARADYGDYSAADEATDSGWPAASGGYGRGTGSYPYSYGTDPGRPGESIRSRGWDWQDAEQDWDVDDGN